MADDEIVIDVEVNDEQTIVCEVLINSGEHNDLHGRDKEDCHPISSITGLEDALAASGVIEEQLEDALNAHNIDEVAHPYLKQLIQNETVRAQSVEDTKMDKKTITDVLKVDGYISTYKSNGVFRTVHRDANRIIMEIV